MRIKSFAFWTKKVEIRLLTYGVPKKGAYIRKGNGTHSQRSEEKHIRAKSKPRTRRLEERRIQDITLRRLTIGKEAGIIHAKSGGKTENIPVHRRKRERASRLKARAANRERGTTSRLSARRGAIKPRQAAHHASVGWNHGLTARPFMEGRAFFSFYRAICRR